MYFTSGSVLQSGTLGTLGQFQFKLIVFMEQIHSSRVWALWGQRARGVMAKPEDYRRYGAECLRLAQEYRDRGEAAALLLEMPSGGDGWLTKRRAARHEI